MKRLLELLVVGLLALFSAGFFFVLSIFTVFWFFPDWGSNVPGSAVRAVESKAQDLVATKATASEVATSFEIAPFRIYARAELRGYRGRAPSGKSKHWDIMLEHAESHVFSTPGGEVWIFFDGSGRAAGFYLNIQ